MPVPRAAYVPAYGAPESIHTHLFSDLLQQRLRHSLAATAPNAHEATKALHLRASQWYEDNGLAFEAFRHATAANDVARAERLMEGKGIPLHFPGAVNAILAWLASLPKSVLDARPLLRVRSATMALTAGQCQDLVESAQAAGRQLAVGHEFRYSALWGRVKELVDAGAIGELQYALIELWRNPYRLGSDGWRYGSSLTWID